MKYESFHVQQLKRNKKWQARLKYKDAEGKWKETTKMLPDSVSGKREAKKLAEAWFNEMNAAADNVPNLDADKTVSEMVLEYAEFQLRTGRIEESTYRRNLANHKNYVEPYIGDYAFAFLDKVAIRAWLSALFNKGLGQGTIANAFQLVKKVYDYQVEIDEMAKNPFTGIKAPKAPKPKISHLTKEQMDEYLAAVYNNYEPEDKFYAAALLLFYGGLRRQEVCALRWRDIDFENNILNIESAIGMGKTTYTKQPKTESSKRSFPMIPQLAEALMAAYEATNPLPNWFVCGDGEKYWNPQSFSNTFRAFVKEYNLLDAYGNYLSPHKLRHNLGAVGIRSNMDIASLSNMMGHSSRAMTLDTYGDASKDAMIVAADKLGDTFNSESAYFKRDEEPPAEEPEEIDLETVKNLTGVYKNYTKAIYKKEKE